LSYTLVNYTPFVFREQKPSQIPTDYTIPAAKEDDKLPGILHVAPAHSRLYMPLIEHPFMVPISSEALAKDLVRSLISSFILYEEGVAEPAIFTVPGFHGAREIKLKFAAEVDAAFIRQNLWKLRMVKEADDSWQKFRQHRAITDLQRWAAKTLGMKKEWSEVGTAAPLEIESCKFCGQQTLKGIAVCPNCKNVLDPVLFKQLSLSSTVTT